MSFTRWLPLLLLLCFFGQTVLAGPHLSLTADEPVHMAQGYVYWLRGDFRLQRPVAQPPLPDLLPGALLALQPGPQPESLPGWDNADLSQFARAFVSWYGPALPAATFAARFPIALIALLGVACAFRWARETFGARGGWLTLALLAFDPNLIAHSGLATTDVLLAVWSLIAVYAAARWSATPRRRSWGVLAGLTLGLALGSKTSGFFPLGIVGLLFGCKALEALWQQRRAPRMWPGIVGAWAGRLALLTGLMLLTLWALYRFELRPLPGQHFPIPFTTHWIIWSELKQHLADGHSAYLLGEVGQTGWWTYYPIAFALKTPLPTLAFLAASGLLWLAQLRTPAGRQRAWARRALWLVPLLYTGAAIASTIDIGYRYLLLMLPFLYILAASCGVSVARRHASCFTLHVSRFTQYALLAWLMLSTLRAFPHYVSYFNELAGGPTGGARYLVDSNLDWGQSFIALRDWLTARPEADKPYLSYYTFADPALYGISYTPIAPARGAAPVFAQRFDPAPGLYALSATPLYGVMTALPENYDWFRRQTPLARPGYGIFVYEVQPSAQPATWLAQCTQPAPPLTEAAIVEGFGRADLRQLAFDCTQSWVYPAGGTQRGWYALHRAALSAGTDAAFISAQSRAARLSYEQRTAGTLPPFALYEQAPYRPQPEHNAPDTLQVGSLTFLGYTLPQGATARAGADFTVVTYWEITAAAPEALSLMLHLSNAEGTVAFVGDGLGFSVEQWQAGDILLQRHRLAISAAAPPGTYTLYTGAYPLSTVQPWPVEIKGEIVGNRIELGEIAVVAAR